MNCCGKAEGLKSEWFYGGEASIKSVYDYER